DAPQVFLGELAGGGFQLQAGEKRVIARLVEVVHRVVKLLLGVQDIIVDADSQLVADLVALYGPLSCGYRGLERLDLRCAAQGRGEGLARVQRCLTLRGRDIGLRLGPLRAGVRNLGMYTSAVEQRHGDLQVDLLVAHFRVVVDRLCDV